MRPTPAHRPRTPARPGVTLLEVLMSLVILVVALAAIGQLVDFGTERASETQLETRGSRLAQSKMAEVEAGVVPVQGGGSGTFDEEPGWEWKVESQLADARTQLPLYAVTVTVTRTLGGRPYTVALSQQMLDPAAVASAAPSEVAPPAPATMTTDPPAGGAP